MPADGEPPSRGGPPAPRPGTDRASGPSPTRRRPDRTGAPPVLRPPGLQPVSGRPLSPPAPAAERSRTVRARRPPPAARRPGRTETSPIHRRVRPDRTRRRPTGHPTPGPRPRPGAREPQTPATVERSARLGSPCAAATDFPHGTGSRRRLPAQPRRIFRSKRPKPAPVRRPARGRRFRTGPGRRSPPGPCSGSPPARKWRSGPDPLRPRLRRPGIANPPSGGRTRRCRPDRRFRKTARRARTGERQGTRMGAGKLPRNGSRRPVRAPTARCRPARVAAPSSDGRGRGRRLPDDRSPGSGAG